MSFGGSAASKALITYHDLYSLPLPEGWDVQNTDGDAVEQIFTETPPVSSIQHIGSIGFGSCRSARSCALMLEEG